MTKFQTEDRRSRRRLVGHWGSSVALTFATDPTGEIAKDRRNPLARYGAMGARFASGLLHPRYTTTGDRTRPCPRYRSSVGHPGMTVVWEFPTGRR
jgi:hypothetical protein